MLEIIFQAFLLGFFLAFTVGPVFFVLIETSILRGFRTALMFDFGVIFGDIVFILIAFFSTNSLLLQIKDDPRLFLFGGFLLLFYGVFSLVKEIFDYKKGISHKKNTEIGQGSAVKLFIKGFLLNAINVGVLGFWLGIIITFSPRLGMDNQKIFFFFSLIILSYLLVDIVKILIAKRLRQKLTSKNIHQLKKITSYVIIVFGFFLVLQSFFPNFKNDILSFLGINL